MRDGSTYRAARRNVARGEEFKRVTGSNWKTPLDLEPRYQTPSKKERYMERKLKKFIDAHGEPPPNESILDGWYQGTRATNKIWARRVEGDNLD